MTPPTFVVTALPVGGGAEGYIVGVADWEAAGGGGGYIELSEVNFTGNWTFLEGGVGFGGGAGPEGGDGEGD